MNSRDEQARATRDRLVAIARQLFAEHGYEGTSLDQVQRRAGLSRGALYHHFSSKHALFEATLDALEADIAAALARSAAAEGDPLDRLRAGSLAWLDLARDPAIRRIALLDAPSVLGWAAQRAIDERRTLGMIRTTLNEFEDLERIPPGSAEVLSHVLLATLNELGLYVAGASDGSAAHERAITTLNVLLERLFGQDARIARTDRR
jgi:AcrR family transcriptional regulator